MPRINVNLNINGEILPLIIAAVGLATALTVLTIDMAVCDIRSCYSEHCNRYGDGECQKVFGILVARLFLHTKKFHALVVRQPISFEFFGNRTSLLIVRREDLQYNETSRGV